jgi:O-antigen/teichoic acid export membrane protein
LLANVTANWLWYMLVMATGFVLPRFIDRHQGEELLGIWDLGWSMVFYVSLLALGVTGAVSRYVARHRAAEDWPAMNATVNSSLLLLGISAALGVAGGGVFAALVPKLLPTASPEAIAAGRWVVMLLSISAAARLLGGAFNAVITGYERFDVLNIIRGGRDILVFAAMVTLLLLGYGIVALAVAALAGQVLGNVVKVVAAGRLCPDLRFSTSHCRRDVARDLLAFGGKTVTNNLARTSLYHVNSILVAYFLGPAVLAVYSRQRALVTRTMRLVKQYAQVFVPTSSAMDAQGDKGSLQRLLLQSSEYGLYLTLPIILILVVLGGPLVHLWMGPNYQAPAVLAVLALGHLASIPQLGVYSILMGMGKHGRPALFELTGAALSVVLGLVALGWFKGNMIGAAVAVALPVALSGGVAMPVYACRLLDLSVWKYVRTIVPGPVLACIPLAGCLVLARQTFLSSPFVALGVGLLVGGLVTAVVYWRWVLPESLKARLWRAAFRPRLRPVPVKQTSA